MVSTGTAIYADVAEQHKRIKSQYENIVTGYGYDPQKALLNYLDDDLLNPKQDDDVTNMSSDELRKIAGF